MKQTEHFDLNLLEADDPVDYTDLNENMTILDEQLQDVKDKAEAAPFVIDSYTGNAPGSGTDPGQLINLGFQPRFLIITRGWTSTVGSTAFLVIGQARVKAQDLVFEWRESGFLVKSTNTSGPLQLNEAGTVYDYIAFK